MKWALIFVFMETGIYETGLTYRSLEACNKAVWEVREMDWSAIGYNGFQNYYGTTVMKCVPTK